MAQGSLAYRTHEAAIWDGHPPEKYRRLLPYISGRRILEIGSAEGVLSLLLASRDPAAHVTGLEFVTARHDAALALQARWQAIGRRVEGCTFVCGDIRERLDLLEGVETFVAIRTIYHLGQSIDPVLSAVAAAGVSSVVLCGNANRERRAIERSRIIHLRDSGDFDWFAGVDGMRQALERAGYQIGRTVAEGDPIVTGHR